MELFNGQNLLEFVEHFKTDENCKEYLSEIKWKTGYTCVKCGHNASQIRVDFSRTCNKCSHIESASANTLFHKVKFGLRKAFCICFEMSTTTKSLSASYMAVRFGVTETTARMFMHKIREAMKSSLNNPMNGAIEVDEFVVGGKETGKVGRSYHSKKKKAVVGVEFTEEGKVKRMYAMKIENFSSDELEKFFTKHISLDASITTDKWRGYTPLKEKFSILQKESDKGLNFKMLHTMIHQVKSWLRTTYSWVSPTHINRYFDEFCYRLNRSQMKGNIFNNLINRMVKADKLYINHIIGS